MNVDNDLTTYDTGPSYSLDGRLHKNSINELWSITAGADLLVWFIECTAQINRLVTEEWGSTLLIHANGGIKILIE